MKRVKQVHSRGCGPAALAMITGKTYAQACGYFARDFETGGLCLHQLDYYLFDHGYAVCRRFGTDGFNADGTQKTRAEWPIAPFAEVELCEVTVSESSPVNHFVVRLMDGAILDPLLDDKTSLLDYFRVLNIAAVVKVEEPASIDEYVAWLHWNGSTYVTCDSDSEGAFRVYRKAATK